MCTIVGSDRYCFRVLVYWTRMNMEHSACVFCHACWPSCRGNWLIKHVCFGLRLENHVNWYRSQNIPQKFGNFIAMLWLWVGLAVFVPRVLYVLAEVDGIHRRRATITRRRLRHWIFGAWKPRLRCKMIGCCLLLGKTRQKTVSFLL